VHPIAENEPQFFHHRIVPIDFPDAVLLYRQFSIQLGHYPVESSAVLTKIRQCNGNPFAIKLLAAMLREGPASAEAETRFVHLMQGLSEREQVVIEVLVLFQQPIGLPFLTLMIDGSFHTLDQTLHAVTGLVGRGLVLQTSQQTILVAAAVRVWLVTAVQKPSSPNRLHRVVDILRTSANTEVCEAAQRLCTRRDFSEFLRIVESASAVLTPNLYEPLAECVLAWSTVFRFFCLNHELLDIIRQEPMVSTKTAQTIDFRMLHAQTEFEVSPMRAKSLLLQLEVDAMKVPHVNAFVRIREMLFWLSVRTGSVQTYGNTAEQLVRLYFETNQQEAAAHFQIEWMWFQVCYGDLDHARAIYAAIQPQCQNVHTICKAKLHFSRGLFAIEDGYWREAQRQVSLAQAVVTDAGDFAQALNMQLLSLHFLPIPTKIPNESTDWCSLYSSVVQYGHTRALLLYAALFFTHMECSYQKSLMPYAWSQLNDALALHNVLLPRGLCFSVDGEDRSKVVSGTREHETFPILSVISVVEELLALLQDSTLRQRSQMNAAPLRGQVLASP
jgi:hypothetical protein